MEFKFSGINIYSFIRNPAFGFWRKSLRTTGDTALHWLCRMEPMSQ